MSCPEPMTTRSRRCIATTRLAPTWPTPPAKWKLCMPSEGKHMEPKTLEYETDHELEQVNRETAREPHRRFGRMRKINRKLLIGGALLLVIAAAAWWWVGTWNYVSTDDAQVDGHIVPVSSKIYRNVTEVMVNDNQQVKKGQILVRLDPRDY